MKGQREDIVYLLDRPYRNIGKDSIVQVNGQSYMIKRIVSICLLEEAVVDKPTVRIEAKAVKC